MFLYELSGCGFEFRCCHLIPVIIMNIENVARWLEHFSLKHRLHMLHLVLMFFAHDQCATLKVQEF